MFDPKNKLKRTHSTARLLQRRGPYSLGDKLPEKEGSKNKIHRGRATQKKRAKILRKGF